MTASETEAHSTENVEVRACKRCGSEHQSELYDICPQCIAAIVKASAGWNRKSYQR